MSLLLVLRMKGEINRRSAVEEALKRLNLPFKFSATLVQDDRTTMGMLRASATALSWCKVDRELLLKLIRNRARVAGYRPLSEDSLKPSGLDFGTLADKLLSGEVAWSRVDGVKPFFRLAPPRGGFPRPSNRSYGSGGLLAGNPELPKLVERMI